MIIWFACPGQAAQNEVGNLKADVTVQTYLPTNISHDTFGVSYGYIWWKRTSPAKQKVYNLKNYHNTQITIITCFICVFGWVIWFFKNELGKLAKSC